MKTNIQIDIVENENRVWSDAIAFIPTSIRWKLIPKPLFPFMVSQSKKKKTMVFVWLPIHFGLENDKWMF